LEEQIIILMSEGYSRKLKSYCNNKNKFKN
jgi:hypothetical protein